jgi:uracil-DNA glycosylase
LHLNLSQKGGNPNHFYGFGQDGNGLQVRGSCVKTFYMHVLQSPSTITSDWREILESEFSKPYMCELAAEIKRERLSGTPIYPPKNLVFNAFNYTPYTQTKVVIMGQDPYHGEGQAHGLSFSVPNGVKPPPSLKNIFKEVESDIGKAVTLQGGNLESWAKQGVLLLNATLTVRKGAPRSHFGKGWETFTDRVVELLLQREQPVIFLLWGKSAKEKVENVFHRVPSTASSYLTASHPSPYSAHAGFFGCKHFSQANAFLEKNALTPIIWT